MCSSYMSFSAQDKVRIVCEVLRGGISPSSISKKYSVPVRSLYRWIEIYKKAPSFHKKRSLTPKYVSGQLHPRRIEATIKLSIVRKIVSGETIANISKGYNIPRRTIQRWLKTYRDAENVDILGANLFKEAYARGIEHPKAIYPKIEGKTLDLVRAT